MNKLFESVLTVFIAQEPDYSGWMTLPFRGAGKVMATNGHSLVVLPDFPNQFVPKEEQAAMVYPIAHTCQKQFSIEQLREAISKAPLIDCFDEITRKCDVCDGEGEVEYSFSEWEFDRTIMGCCPACEGEGQTTKTSIIPNGKKEVSPLAVIKIGLSTMAVGNMSKLLRCAELLNCSTITLVSQVGKFTLSLFAVGDAEVLLMPTMTNEENTPVATIPLHSTKKQQTTPAA
ncbi:hypothetical protein [Spirosoma luteum]|uniref:hypothetical protein n=1 Tax=Spirosoma luteum TaxID=431553 RepID=UPI00035D5040|nr:hypothetical protein [Spirosoma luteum]